MIGVTIDPDLAATTYLYARAAVTSDGTVTILPCDAVTSTQVLRTQQQAGRGGSSMTFASLDESGAELATATAMFDPLLCDAFGDGTALVSAYLPVAVDRPPTAVSASLKGKPSTLMKLPPPLPVKLEFADAPGQDEVVRGPRKIRWLGGGDPGNERHSLWYSADGITWTPLDLGIPNAGATVDFDYLPGSKKAQLRVVVARGATIFEARSPTFVVATPPLRLKVARPAGKTTVGVGRALRVEARASDPVAGPVTDPRVYEWSSDLDGPLGVGATRSVYLKTTGNHAISASVANDAGDVTVSAPAKVTVTREAFAFLHTATAANTQGNATRIQHGAETADRTAMLQVTAVCKRGGGVVAAPRAIGVRYLKGAWEIVALDGKPISVGAQFVVDWSGPGPTTFSHVAGPQKAERMPLKHAVLDNNPHALLLATPVQLPYDPPVPPSPAPVAACYRSRQWQIQAEAGEQIAARSAYSLEALLPGAEAYLHTAAPANVNDDVTYLDHPALNGKPGALVQITPRLGSSNGVRNPHATGVWYDRQKRRWGIVNPAKEPMPPGAAFTVAVTQPDSPDG